MVPDYVDKLIKRHGLGYGVPLILFNAAVAGWVFGRPLIEVGIAILIALVWPLGYWLLNYIFLNRSGRSVGDRSPIVPLVLAGIAVAGLLSYWLLSYFFLNPPDRAVKTGSGKLGFYVASVEGDSGNRRQKRLLQALHDGITAHADLKKVEVHDLRQTIPHGAPNE